MSDRGRERSEFLAESAEILETLGRDLLVLDEGRGGELDPELLNGIFRGAHSLKGLAGMFGEDRLATLAHAAEDLLDHLRLGKVEVSDPVVDSLVEVVDVLQALLAEASREETTGALGSRATGLASRLRGLTQANTPPQADLLDQLDLDPATRKVFTEYEEHRLRENLRKGMTLYRVRAEFDLSDFDLGLARLNGQIKPQGEVISTLPSQRPGDETGIAFDLIYGTRRPERELLAALEGTLATAERLGRVEPAASPKKPRRAKGSKRPAPAPEASNVTALPTTNGATPARSDNEASLRSLTETVRVDIRRLDSLMNAVGELLLIKGNLQRLAESAGHSSAIGPSRAWSQELTRESRALERKLEEVQEGLLGARMVPLGQVFEKLARLVRRLARDAGKELELVLSGGEVELDKLIVEELSDPLMHTIRNAIDHGIESPEVRAAQGKPRKGRISLRAAQRGNRVLLEVSDDGAGINEARVREVAVQRGLLTADEARELPTREAQNLIFTPGFSTARSISELSGRGVGLDVVKTNIASLSGLIDVRSERGAGTTFEITLPVTLAIVRALVVGAEGRTYAIPLSGVLEILSLSPSEVRTVERRELLPVRGRTLPLVRLAPLFGHGPGTTGPLFALVLGLAQERIALVVDQLHGQQDIVVKPLGGRLSHIRGISGATDLGNRQTVLVLDVGALIEDSVAPEWKAEAL
ncbi:MAG: chemotaxis protein CheA [Myxococcota bacterium]|nr:chemotaxis protein CheA [Myxococcota bacterium]